MNESPRRKLKFFFDRQLALRTARMLEIYEKPNGRIVKHHDDHGKFARNAKDIDIIRTLYDEDPEWVLVSCDRRILKNEAELAALVQCDMTYLQLDARWNKNKIEETCWQLIKGWPKVVETVGKLQVHSLLILKYGDKGATIDRGATAKLGLRDERWPPRKRPGEPGAPQGTRPPSDDDA